MSIFYLGVDVALAHLDVATATTPISRTTLGRFANERAGWQALQEAVTQALCKEEQKQATREPTEALIVHLVMEPTGGYEAGLLYFAYEQGWRVSMVNPLQVRRWAEGQGLRAKTDRQDALMLAWFGASQAPSPQEPMDEGAAELDELLRRRNDLEQLRRAERNRLAQAKHKPRTPAAVKESLERTLRTLEEELQKLEQAIQQLLKCHPYLHKQRQLLRSAPAIGEKLSLEMLVLCHRFWAYTQGQGTAKQLVAYIGLDPKPHQSGNSRKRAPISHQGDVRLRALLYCGALGGIRGNNPLKDWYHHLVAEGKAKKLALVACARKVLTWVWALFTSNSSFDATRFHSPSSIQT